MENQLNTQTTSEDLGILTPKLNWWVKYYVQKSQVQEKKALLVLMKLPPI